MVKLVENRANTVEIRINAAIDISGFSIVLAACGVLKSKNNLTIDGWKVEYTAEQAEQTSKNGTYGTLIVYDNKGNQYLKYLPFFVLIPESNADSAIGNQVIRLTIASTKEASKGSDSGGGVTMDEVNEAINDAISDIGQTIISTEEVTVETTSGEPVTMTVKESVQQVVQAMETHLIGSVKDEDEDGQPDGEILYLDTEKNNLTPISS